MAQVKIHGLRSAVAPRRAAISDAIQRALVTAFGLPEDKRFQRFLLLDREDFVHPRDRTDDYLIVEISCFEGRSVETKKALIRQLFRELESAVGIAPQDVEITITETPRANWGIRGQVGDELVLSYRVTT